MSCVTSAGAAWRVHDLGWSVAGRDIVTGVHLGGEAGEITALLGPNGSGKTTVLSMLGGIRRPSRGRIEITTPGAAPRSLRRMRPRARARVLALVEQEASTQLGLTVRQVVELGRIPHRRQAPDHDHSVVDEAMGLADIATLADRSWDTLSGGERQRTQLARALAQQPSLLLLDEPTNHLDLHHQIDLLSRVRSLGVSTVAALHDLELAAAFCDRAAVLDHGRLVASGPVDDVITSSLLDEVFAVDADVEPHPRADRPHVRWTGLRSGTRETA